MRLLEGIGCEYGTEWVIEEILKEHLESVDEEKAFEEMMEGCYPIDTKVAWLEINTIDILKEMCSCDWELAQGEYISSLEEYSGLLFERGFSAIVGVCITCLGWEIYRSLGKESDAFKD